LRLGQFIRLVQTRVLDVMFPNRDVRDAKQANFHRHLLRPRSRLGQALNASPSNTGQFFLTGTVKSEKLLQKLG
jgi:hypothetical protein